MVTQGGRVLLIVSFDTIMILFDTNVAQYKNLFSRPFCKIMATQSAAAKAVQHKEKIRKGLAGFKLEPAKIGELSQIVKLEHKAWPPPKSSNGAMQADAEKFRKRIEKGCLYLLKRLPQPVVLADGEMPPEPEIVGMITAQKVDLVSEAQVWQVLGLFAQKGIMDWAEIAGMGFPRDWYEATADGNLDFHKPDGKIGWLVGVSVDPGLRGNGLVNKIIGGLVEHMHSEGINYVIGYGRMPQLHKLFGSGEEALPHLVEYLQQARGDGLSVDYGVRFHQNNGAKSVSPIPYAMAEGDDWESLGHGFLAVYDLKKVMG